MQAQLTFSDGAPEAAPGGVSTQNDSMHRDDAAGAEQSRGFGANLQIRVQLQDALGGTLQEATPNSEGKVQMTVCRDGAYRLRVTGPTIEETLVEDLQPGRGDRVVNITLHHKLTKEQAKAEKATVSAQGLRVPRKAQKALDKGDAGLRRGKLDEAQKYYEKAIEIDPQFEQAENNLGIVLMREGRKKQGKAAFDRAIAINNHYAPAQVNLAKIAFDEKRFHDAGELVKQALKSEPLNTTALFVAAEAAFFNGEFAETVRYARTLHSLPHRQFALIHFLAAKSLEAENQPLAALTEYQTFLDEDPTDPNGVRARERLMLLQASRLAESQQNSRR
jgi:tetratricopeptide (TPR) repeat protein